MLDVGANMGQTGLALREGGYAGRICSFEPIAQCFARLAARAAADPHWQVRHTGIGDRDGTARIGVSENLVSSSFRDLTERIVAIHPPVRYGRHEDTVMSRLDRLLDQIARPEDVIHLKIDTQGFEREVIRGAAGVWGRIGSVRMEVAVTAVYQGEMTLPEAITMMAELGHLLIEAWPAWRHPATGEVLHFDLLFRQSRPGEPHGPALAG